MPRPTTETTVEALCDWLQYYSDVKSILFVSNQPYVLYQNAIIREVFENVKMPISFEVCGPQANINISTKTLVGEVGRYIWATTPHVLEQIVCDD